MKAFKGVSKRWRFGFVAIYALILFSPFFSSTTAPISTGPALAAGTTQLVGEGFNYTFDPSIVGEWVDRDTIQYDQWTFKDKGINDTNWVFEATAGGPNFSGCATSRIDTFNTSSDPSKDTTVNLTLNYPVRDANGKVSCYGFRHNINLGNDWGDGLNIAFNWVNSTTVTSADGKYTYTLDSTTNQYYRSPDNGCADSMSISTDKQTATLTIRYPDSTGNSVSYDYEGYPFKFAGGIHQASDTGKCKVSQPIPSIKLGDVSNSSVPGLTTEQKKQSGSGTDCQFSGPFSYIVCPLFGLAQDAYFNLEDAVVSTLRVPPLLNSSTSVQNAMSIWSSIKNMTNVVFILIFLAIIFSTTLSLGLTNYNVKKMLPRLVVAAILVQFSWVLMQLSVDVSNILGAGIKALPIFNNVCAKTITDTAGNVTQVVKVACSSTAGGGPQFHGASEVVFGLGVAGLFIAGAAALLLVIPLLLAVFSAVMGILAVFVTLYLRQLIIIILIVLSPLALAAWVLPNTENVFKTWLKSLMRLLLMYPLIVFIFSAAGLFSTIATPNSGVSGTIQGIAASILPIYVFYLVPWTFKWAGGAMTAVGGWVTSRASGISGAAQNSQFARDAKLQRREKGALRANDESKTPFGRYLGRVQAGGAIGGAGSRRRLSAAYSAALSARGQDYESDFLRRNLKTEQLQGIASAANGARVHGVKVDDAARAKAIELLGRNGDYDALRAVKKGMGGDNMSTGQARIWQSGISKNIGDMLGKAPDLVSGSAAFHNVSAEKLAGYHKSTVSALTGHLATPEGSQDIKGILRALQNIENSPGLKGKVDGFGLGNLVEHASLFAGESTPSGASGETWLRDHTATSSVNSASPGEPPDMKTTASFV